MTPALELPPSPRILFIRRDNIGDLVCTTPVFAAVREAFPKARLEALVNTYTRAIVARDPNLDEIHAYTKLKHLSGLGERLAFPWRRFSLLAGLRARSFDLVLIACNYYHAQSVRLARLMRPGRVLGFVDPERPDPAIDIAIPYTDPGRLHLCEDLFRLLVPLGIARAPPKLTPLVPGSPPTTRGPGPLRLAVHISARKSVNRWPEERHVTLVERLQDALAFQPVLFWAPGAADQPGHPGDDDKAARVAERLRPRGIVAHPTQALEDLIDGLATCDAMICSDGGAMHVAAALGKPVVCLFGNSTATYWRPWCVPHRLLQPPSHDVKDISVDEAYAAVLELLHSTGVVKG